MSKSKLTLLIDGNWLLMSRLSVISNKYYDDYELCQDLKLMLIKSINVVLRQFPMIDNLIFCADAGSWRNKIELPKYLIQQKETEGIIVEYKGTRTRSSDINWELVFDAYDDFLLTLTQTGINVSREKDIEGDDWIYHWSKELNKQGTNCIIWTKDNDLKQLVHTDNNMCFTIWWNKDTGVFTDNYNEEDLNFLFNYEFNENDILFNDIVKKSINVTKILPEQIIIDKIIKGDGSDNILPIIVRKSKTNSTKVFKVSTKDINYELDFNNDTNVRSYIHELINKKNYLGRIDKSEEDIVDHFKYNRTLIVLNDKYFPDYVKDILNSYNDYNLSKDTSLAESQIQASANKLKGILDII